MLGGQRENALLTRCAHLGGRAQGQRHRAVNDESQFARTIKDALDAGLGLSPEASARLKVARERALERHRVPAREIALAGAGRGGRRAWRPEPFPDPDRASRRIPRCGSDRPAAVAGSPVRRARARAAGRGDRRDRQRAPHRRPPDQGLSRRGFPGMAKAHLGIALALCLGLSRRQRPIDQAEPRLGRSSPRRSSRSWPRSRASGTSWTPSASRSGSASRSATRR